LCERGLVHPETMTLASPELADFVRASKTNADLAAWQDADGGTAWNMVRVPLATGITALLVLLTNNNPELAATGALVPAIAAALPAILKVLTPSPTAR